MKWKNEEELKLLIKYYTIDKLSVAETAKKLNRPFGQVKNKIKRLHLYNNRCKKWTEKDVQALIKLNEESKSLKEMSLILKASEVNISTKLISLGITYKKRPRVSPHLWTLEEIDKLKLLAASGCVISRISKEMGISKGAISYFAEKENIIIKREKINKFWTKEEEEIIKNSLKSYITVAEIANKLKRSSQSVIERMALLNLKPTSRLNRYWQRKGNSKGYGEISGSVFNKIRQNAKTRSLQFDITIQQMWNIFIEQDRKCAISGVLLYFSEKCDGTDTTASLDRIDSSKGYTLDNVQWIHKDLQRMKWDMNESKFYNWIKIILNNQTNKEQYIDYYI